LICIYIDINWFSIEDIFDEEVDVVYMVKKGEANKCDTKSADIPITRQVPARVKENII
jgi:hypothetical protein